MKTQRFYHSPFQTTLVYSLNSSLLIKFIIGKKNCKQYLPPKFRGLTEHIHQMLNMVMIDGFIPKETRTRHLISMKMQHTRCDKFENWLRIWENVESTDKTSCDSCYQIMYATDNLTELEHFLNKLLQHGTYRLHSSIQRMK